MPVLKSYPRPPPLESLSDQVRLD